MEILQFSPVFLVISNSNKILQTEKSYDLEKRLQPGDRYTYEFFSFLQFLFSAVSNQILRIEKNRRHGEISPKVF